MALSGWDESKKVSIAIPQQPDELTDFPVQINLTDSCGTSGFDASSIFEELTPLDPHWSSVVLAMPMDGVDNATSFTDLKGHAVTTSGNTHIENTQSKFGGTSAYFDGTGDYLSLPNSEDWDFGAGEFTIECWIYVAQYAPDGLWRGVVCWHQGTLGWRLLIGDSGELHFATDSGVQDGFLSTPDVISLNTWTHVVVTGKSSGATGWSRCYVNGVSVAYKEILGFTSPGVTLKIGSTDGNNWFFSGYIDDLRITKGVARYTADFTPPTRSTMDAYNPLFVPTKLAIEYNNTGTECYVEVERWDAVNKSAQLWVKAPSVSAAADTVLALYYDSTHAGSNHVDDPHWSSVVLAMPMDGADGATAFTDLKGHSVTADGNTNIENTQSKFGGSSAYFDGVGDYLSIPSSTDFDFGTGDFCIEFWVNSPSVPSQVTLLSRYVTWATSVHFYLSIEAGNYIHYRAGNNVPIHIVSTIPVNIDDWNHVAVTCNSGLTRIFVNGVVAVTSSIIVSLSSTAPLGIGYELDGDFAYLNGYIDDLRITKGVARYTADFTPPTRSAFGTVGTIGQHQAKNVWTNDFAAVYHLSQDPSATVKDSTTNARDLTPYGSMTTGQLVDGPTGKAISFDGVNDYMQAAGSDLSALQTTATCEITGKINNSISGSILLSLGSPAAGALLFGRYTTTSYMRNSVYGNDVQSGVSVGDGFRTYGGRLSAGVQVGFGDGSLDGVTNSVSIQSLSSAPINLAYLNGSYYSQIIRSVRISSVSRSAAWLNAAYLSDFDMLLSIYMAATRGPRGKVSCVYDLVPWMVRAGIGQIYDLTFHLAAAIEQTYGIKLGAILSQPYGDVGTIRQESVQWYGNASLIRAAMTAVYGPAIRTSALLNHIYSLPDQVLVSAWQSYAISGATPRGVLAQTFNLSSTDLVRNFSANPYAILGDNGQVLAYTTSVIAGGATINPSGISISGSLNEYCLSCDLELATQADYLACAVGVDLEVTINSETYRFFVEGRGRSREHGSTGYTIHGLSKTALLDAPYSGPVSVELTGMASTIAASLAPGYALQWDTVDWLIPANTLLPADKTPLEVLRELAHAAGAIIQTAPDGTLIVQANYIQAVPSWGTATPDYLLSDSLDFFTDSAEYEHRDGYNKFLISDQLTTNDTVRLEEETVTDTTKLIRGYKTPWEETFTLRHTSGDWVTIEPLGVETIDKIEVIEFVAGTGRTQYPIYGITDMAWLQNNLGVVTHSEDGSLESSVPEESLLSITYQTKCLKWKAVNPQSEKVQFVAEEPAI